MQGSSFRPPRGKLPAGRIFVAQDLGVHGSYTLETSLAGDGKTKTHHTIANLLRLGESLCLAIHDLISADAESLMKEVAAATVSVDGSAAPKPALTNATGPERIGEDDLKYSPDPAVTVAEQGLNQEFADVSV
jgi:imidazoleglycerol phosphate dehydratase HisB